MRTDIRRIAFAYLRLSNEEAAEGESSSIKNQRMIIQDYCERNEILLVRVFVDDGWSGGNFDRPAFQEMIALLEQGKANIVITKRPFATWQRHARGQLLCRTVLS